MVKKRITYFLVILFTACFTGQVVSYLPGPAKAIATIMDNAGKDLCNPGTEDDTNQNSREETEDVTSDCMLPLSPLVEAPFYTSVLFYACPFLQEKGCAGLVTQPPEMFSDLA